MQHIAGAVAASGAFEGADPDVGRVNREVAIAALAVRAYLQHANRAAGTALHPRTDPPPGRGRGPDPGRRLR